MKRKFGKLIIPHGLRPESHELETVDIFTALGFDVEFLIPSRTKGSRTPDVNIEGVLWEIKSPTGIGRRVVQDQLSRAIKQSKNIIFDARRTKLNDEKIQLELEKHIKTFKSIKRLTLILKNEKIVYIKK